MPEDFSKIPPERRVLIAIKNRCLWTTPGTRKYQLYKDRGIKICERWLGRGGYHNFLEDMGPKPGPEYTIDRIDNDGNYEPGNCRWATRKEQARNTRTNIHIQYKGKRMLLIAVAEKTGIPYGTLDSRIRRGWSAKKALNTPVVKEQKSLEPGQRFGKRKVLRLTQIKHGDRYYECRCDCGNVSEVRESQLHKTVQCQTCANRKIGRMRKAFNERRRRCIARPRRRFPRER